VDISTDSTPPAPRPPGGKVEAIFPRSSWPWRAWRACWWVAAIFIFAEGALTRFRLPQLPLIAPDSYFYLLPAINGGVYNIGPRTFVYPMFCSAVLHALHDWNAFSIVQHVLGLLGPALLLAAWVFLGARVWVSRLARGAHELVGLALPFLTVPSAIYVIYEEQVVLESLNAFFQCCLGALLCLLWLPMLSRRRLVIASLTAIMGIFMYYANPRWGPAAPLVVIFAILAVVMTSDPIRRRLRSACVVLAFAIVTYFGLGQVQARLVPRDEWLNTFTAKHLLWMHADLALNEFRRDLDEFEPPPYADLLRKMIPKIEKEMVGVGTSHWMTIPFNAAALLYVADCPDADLGAYFKGNPIGYRDFCLHYYFRIISHQPGAYWGEVWRMLLYYYDGPQNDGAFREFSVAITDAFPGCAPVVRYIAGFAQPAIRAQLEALAIEMEKKTDTPVVYRPDPTYHDWVRRVHVCFLPVTLAGLVAAIIILLRPRLRARRELAVLAWLCLASVTVLFAQVLTLAMVTVTEGRYADALRTLAAFSLVCALAVAGSLLVEFITARRGSRPSPAA
jgi:hypothetical protein